MTVDRTQYTVLVVDDNSRSFKYTYEKNIGNAIYR